MKLVGRRSPRGQNLSRRADKIPLAALKKRILTDNDTTTIIIIRDCTFFVLRLYEL